MHCKLKIKAVVSGYSNTLHNVELTSTSHNIPQHTQPQSVNPFTPRSDQYINSPVKQTGNENKENYQPILSNSQQRFVWSLVRRSNFQILGVKGLSYCPCPRLELYLIGYRLRN